MWALIALGAVQGVASVFQGRSQAKQYAGQAAVAKYNAMLTERDVRAKERATDFAQAQQALRSASVLGEWDVNRATSGATEVGGPFRVRRQIQRQLDIDNALIGMQGGAQASALRSEAAMYTMQKKMFRKAGKWTIISGLFGAGAAALRTKVLKDIYYPSAPGSPEVFKSNLISSRAHRLGR